MSTQPKTKILLVDDDTDLLHILKDFLEGHQYEVLTAVGAPEAFEKIEQKPDLIILDLIMPGTTGIEIAQRLRTLKVSISTPIIFLTAYSDTSYIVDAVEAGAFDYILKPIDHTVLLQKIEDALRGRNRLMMTGS